MVTARDPGKRNQRITIERNTRTADGAGQLSDSWATYISRWAEVTPVSGGERFKGHQLQADVTHALFLPSDTGTRAITVKDRVKVKGKTLAILLAYDVELSGVEVMLQCKEIL